jgi:hypothetical protein
MLVVRLTFKLNEKHKLLVKPDKLTPFSCPHLSAFLSLGMMNFADVHRNQTFRSAPALDYISSRGHDCLEQVPGVDIASKMSTRNP